MPNQRLTALPSLLFLVSLAIVVCVTSRASADTALEHLRAAKQPKFKEGHTLLPLSRWGWAMPEDVSIELCERWGYALEFGSYATMDAAKGAHDKDTRQGRLCALTAKDPDRYPLFLITHRPLSQQSFVDKLPESFWLHDAEGKRIEGPTWKIKNPLAPDAIHEDVAQGIVGPLEVIREVCPIAIVLHGGESGLTEFGHSKPFITQDPAVMKAKGDREWWDFYSEQKARWEMPTSRAVRKALPDRKAYIWYHFAGMPGWTPWQWTWNYDHMRPVADMPGQSLYYKQFNSGWTGDADLLTYFLASVAQAKTYGDDLGYNWLCAGWEGNKNQFSDLDRYMGYVKCVYTAGQVGGVAGYFSHPKGGFAADVGDDIPHWLAQMMILGRAHALFSHLEAFIREGDLLPGDGEHAIVKQRWDKKLPSYEFNTGDADARVVARKHRKRNEWLVTAWAAAGDARKVRVFIDGVGELALNARPAGSVYRVKAEVPTQHEPPVVEIELIDTDAILPTQGL